MSEQDEIQPDDAERQQAERYRRATDALDKGRAGIDDLPVVADDDPLMELMPITHALRGQGPAASLSNSRRDAVWGDIEERLEAAAAQAPARPRIQWWHTLLGLGAAAAAIFLVVWATRPAPGPTPDPPEAVAAVDQELPSYAAKLMAPGDSPRGDTRLHDLRDARFDAWRTDASWNQRYRSAPR